MELCSVVPQAVHNKITWVTNMEGNTNHHSSKNSDWSSYNRGCSFERFFTQTLRMVPYDAPGLDLQRVWVWSTVSNTACQAVSSKLHRLHCRRTSQPDHSQQTVAHRSREEQLHRQTFHALHQQLLQIIFPQQLSTRLGRVHCGSLPAWQRDCSAGDRASHSSTPTDFRIWKQLSPIWNLLQREHHVSYRSASRGKWILNGISSFAPIIFQ